MVEITTYHKVIIFNITFVIVIKVNSMKVIQTLKKRKLTNNIKVLMCAVSKKLRNESSLYMPFKYSNDYCTHVNYAHEIN